MKRILLIVAGLLAAIAGVGYGKTVVEPKSLYKHAGSFSSCPARPSCVSSIEDAASDAYVSPLPGVSTAQLSGAIVSMGGRVMEQRDNYIHAVFVTPKMRFHDDFEALRREGEAQWDIRSVSRFGYRDFGVNGQRVVALRAKLATDQATGE